MLEVIHLTTTPVATQLHLKQLLRVTLFNSAPVVIAGPDPAPLYIETIAIIGQKNNFLPSLDVNLIELRRLNGSFGL